MRYIVTPMLLILPTLLCSRAFADGELTLKLPAWHDATSFGATSGIGGRPAVGGQAEQNRSLGARPSARTQVVGRLGMAAADIPIRAGHSTRSRELSRAAAGTYLAIEDTYNHWYAILMQDGSTGWVPTGSVHPLDYNVVGPNNLPYRHMSTPRIAVNYSYGGSAVLSRAQQGVIAAAMTYMGTPYRYGGESRSGIDCSSFVQHCFASIGIGLPRTAHEQCCCGIQVAQADLQTGDRLYFRDSAGDIIHTGIYVGGGEFIHASGSLHKVGISRLDEPFYQQIFAAARR